MNVFQQHTKELNELCKTYKVKNLYAFGSVLTDKFNSLSDVDLIVSFQQLDVLDYADNYFDFKFSLESIFKRKVDLLEESAIQNPHFLSAINQHKKLIYG
jgi:predicted nucleotidyltransferase